MAHPFPSGAGGLYRVVLVDDHALVLAGMRDLVNSSTDFTVVGEFLSGAAVLRSISDLGADLVILDLRMGDYLGPELCRRIRSVTSARVLMLTGFGDAGILKACLDEGAAGVLLKASADLDIVDAMTRVMRGETVLDPSVGATLADGATTPVRGSDGVVYAQLRSSEYKVLRLMAQGSTTREIQDELGLTNNTVRSYAQSLMEKLDAHSRVQLIVKARAMRLV